MKKSLIIILFIGIMPIIGFSQEYSYILKDEHDRIYKLEIDTRNNILKWVMSHGNYKYMDITNFRDGKSKYGEYFLDLHLKDRSGDKFFLIVLERTGTVEMFNRKGEYVSVFKIQCRLVSKSS